MVSTDFNGGPIFILGLQEVKLLASMLSNGVSLATKGQPELVNSIFNFLDDPACVAWEEEHGPNSQP